MSEKHLAESGWKSLVDEFDIKDTGLKKALASFGSAKEDDHEARLKALKSIKDAIAPVRKAHKEKEVVAYLAEIEKEVEKTRKAIEVLRKKEEEEEETEAGENAAESAAAKKLAAVKASLVGALSKIKAAQGAEAHSFLACVAKPCYGVLIGKSPAEQLGAGHKALLTSLTTGTKFISGTCLFENKAHTFVVKSVPGGLANNLKAALAKFAGGSYLVRVRDPDGTVVLDSETDVVPGADDDEAKEKKKQVAVFQQRLKALMPGLAAALKAQKGDTSKLRAVAEFAREKSAAGDLASALKALDALEKLLAAGGGAGKGAGEKPQEQEQAKEQEGEEEAQAQEQAKAQVEQLRKQIEAELAGLKQVVDSIQEAALRQPVAEGLAKLSASLEAALKLEKPGDQAGALTALTKEIGPVRSQADQAALDSAALVAARERAAQLASQSEKELAQAELAVQAIVEASLQSPEAQQLDGLKKRHGASAGLTDPAVQEKEFTALLLDIAKLKESAAAAKVKSDELQAAWLRVSTAKTQVETELAALKAVVDSIKEATLGQPSVEALATLNTSLAAALKLGTPGEQEAALTTLTTQIPPARVIADKAALDSAALIAARERVAKLKTQVDTELAALKGVVDSILEATFSQPSVEALATLNTSLAAALKLATPAEQEAALTTLTKEIPPARVIADKAALDFAALVAARERVAKLKLQAETELAAVEILVKSTGSTLRGKTLATLQQTLTTTSGLTDLAAQEKDFPALLGEIAKLKISAETFLKDRGDYEKAFKAMEADLNKANGACGAKPAVPDALAQQFRDAFAAVKDFTKRLNFPMASGKLPALKAAAELVIAELAKRTTFYAEFTKIETEYKAVRPKVVATNADTNAAMTAAFLEAEKKVSAAINIKDWPGALTCLGELEAATKDASRAVAARASYEAAFGLIEADYKEVKKLITGAGVPQAYEMALTAAENAAGAKQGAKEWAVAEGLLPALKAEIVKIKEMVALGAAYYDEFKKIEADYLEAMAIANKNENAPASVAAQFYAALNDLTVQVEAEAWVEAGNLLPALESAAAAVKKAHADRQSFNGAYGPIRPDWDEALKLINGAGIPKALGDAFTKECNAMLAQYNVRQWADATATLPALRSAIDRIKQVAADGAAYYSEYAKIEAVYNDAVKVVKDNADDLTEELKTKFETAKSTLKGQVETQSWAAAVLTLKQLEAAANEIKKADEESAEFWKVFNPIQARYNKAFNAANKAGLADPEGKNMTDANSAMMKGYSAKDWVLAASKVPAIVTAVEAVEAALLNPTAAAYYTEFEKIVAKYDKAMAAFKLGADKLDLLSKRVLDTRKVAQDAAKKKDFTVATNALPSLGTAVDALVAAAATYEGEHAKFMVEFNKITKLAAAQKIASRPPKKLAAVEAKTFRDRYIPFNDAKNAGDFPKATAAITDLQAAIDALVDANAAYLLAKTAFEAELKKVTDLPAALAIAEGGSAQPLIVAKVTPFTQAKKAVDDAAALEEWVTAKGLVATLSGAVTQLLEAQRLANTALQGDDAFQAALTDKIEKLEPRTDLASEDKQPTYIQKLQKTVRDRLGAIMVIAGKNDFVTAETEFAKLLVDLDAMEAAKPKYQKHFKAFDAAKKGEVDKARKLAFTSPKLAGQRTTALQKTEDQIVAWAGNGKLDKADKMVLQWINEAKAWQASEAAFNNLESDPDPDPAKLKALGGMPGGGKVLDALMEGMPDDKPQKFMKEAMNARFGFTVKQFEKKDPDRLENLPATEINKELPDKSLKKMYQLLAAVPEANVKGTIKELIRFDEDQGGAAFTGGTKKIVWMYCGRANDPAGTKQQFNQPGSIVPKGEEVDPDCQAVDDKEVPYFDFATLHEVGHAVESAQPALVTPMAASVGWQTHKSADVAAIAAAHFKYDLDFVKATLRDKNSNPPPDVATVPSTSTPVDWAKARDAVVDWCQSVRVGNELWNKPGVSKQVAIGGRVYQEAYANDWVSYLVAARSKGISSYQFRSSGEWFAEIYAAYFSGKLKKTHPLAPQLKKLKTP